MLARHGRSNDRENAGANNSAYAKSGKRPRTEAFSKRMLGLFRLLDELVDRFAGEQLADQFGPPDARTDPECAGFITE
jgi:hypothetical protein